MVVRCQTSINRIVFVSVQGPNPGGRDGDASVLSFRTDLLQKDANIGVSADS